MFVNCPRCGFLVALDAQQQPLPRCPNCAMRMRDDPAPPPQAPPQTDRPTAAPSAADAEPAPGEIAAVETAPPTTASDSDAATANAAAPYSPSRPQTDSETAHVSPVSRQATVPVDDTPPDGERSATMPAPSAPATSALSGSTSGIDDGKSGEALADTATAAAPGSAAVVSSGVEPKPAHETPAPAFEAANETVSADSVAYREADTASVPDLVADAVRLPAHATPAGHGAPVASADNDIDSSADTGTASPAPTSVEPARAAPASSPMADVATAAGASSDAAAIDTPDRAATAQPALPAANAIASDLPTSDTPAPTASATLSAAAEGSAADVAAALPPVAGNDAAAAPSTATARRTRPDTPSFVRVAQTAPPVDRRRKALHIAAIALLALTLALQLLLSDRASLAADARWRPVLASLCGALRCTLPAWHEPQAFTLLERDISAHATRPGVLRVSARMRNDARWPQPWPLLQLTLSDAHGRDIATRLFAPGEYLGGAPTQRMLGSGQDTALAMDVVEPGAQAVAFTFDFR